MSKDAELVKKLKDAAQKEKAFSELLDVYQERLYWHIRKIVATHENADDVLQNTFIRIYKNILKFEEKSSLHTWMYRIALNVAISFYRKEKKWSTKSDYYNEESIFRIEEDKSEEKTELDYHLKLLQEFIHSLNELNKALILLYLEEKSYEEIAEILGITKTNVATKISRIKIKLKNKFQNI